MLGSTFFDEEIAWLQLFSSDLGNSFLLLAFLGLTCSLVHLSWRKKVWQQSLENNCNQAIFRVGIVEVKIAWNSFFWYYCSDLTFKILAGRTWHGLCFFTFLVEAGLHPFYGWLRKLDFVRCLAVTVATSDLGGTCGQVAERLFPLSFVLSSMDGLIQWLSYILLT